MTSTEPALFLSPTWAASLPDLAVDAPTAGPSLGVDQIVTGGPDGDVVVRYQLDDGQVTSCEVVTGKTPPAPVAPVVLTNTYRDAVALVQGELDINAAFMSGQMKVAGDTGPLLDVLAWSQRRYVGAWREAVSAATAV